MTLLDDYEESDEWMPPSNKKHTNDELSKAFDEAVSKVNLSPRKRRYHEDSDDLPDSPTDPAHFQQHAHALNLQERDLSELKHLDDVNKKLVVHEMADLDVLIHNVHKGFRFATSVRAIGSLVRDALAIQRHRRVVMAHVSQGTNKKGDIVIGMMGGASSSDDE